MLVAALLVAAMVSAAGERRLAAGEIAGFVAQIGGAWQGQATITPIGPRPYDIVFTRNAAGELEGAADPGGAIHTWTFDADGEHLGLRFLSSFRGNREPLLLAATGEIDGEVIFQARRPDFLQVRMRATAQTLVMRVFHHDRLHVEIRLQRR